MDLSVRENEVRKTIRFPAPDLLYIQGLVNGLGLEFSPFVRDVVLKYGAQYATELRKNGRPEGFRRRAEPRPHVSVVDELAKSHNLPAEVVRRRLLTRQVLLDGQPYTDQTIAPRLLPKLTFA